MAELLPITKDILSALDAGMKKNGIGWEELQEQTGITWAAVRKWRLGLAIPKVETATVALGAVGYEMRVQKKS